MTKLKVLKRELKEAENELKRNKNVAENKELIIFSISTEDAITDAISRVKGNNSIKTLRDVHRLIEKYTSRKGSSFLGGF